MMQQHLGRLRRCLRALPLLAVSGALILGACGTGGDLRAKFAECLLLGFSGSEPERPLLEIEVRFLSVDDNFLADVGVDLKGLGAVDPPNPPLQGARNGEGEAVAAVDSVVGGGTGSWLGLSQNLEPDSFLPTLFPNGVGPFPGFGVFPTLHEAECVKFFSGAAVDLTGMPDEYQGTTLAPYGDLGDYKLAFNVLTPEEHTNFLLAAQGYAGTVILTAPFLHLSHGQHSMVMVEDYSGPPVDFDASFAQAAQNVVPGLAQMHTGPMVLMQALIAPPLSHFQVRVNPMAAGATYFGDQFPLLGGATPSGVQIPIVQPGSRTTTVTVPDGGTVLIGGLKYDGDVDVTPGVPALARIPYVGSLFGQTPSLAPDRTLLIMITGRLWTPP